MGKENPQFGFDAALLSRFKNNLNAFSPVTIENGDLRPAAVAIVLVKDQSSSAAVFLLTRRASRLARHGGQYALPGGRVDDGEDVCSAALRELREELGLNATRASVIGQLDDFPTRSGFRISPVIVWLEGHPVVRRNTGEVEAVFFVPISDLDQPGIPRLHHIPESSNPVLSMVLESLGDEVFSPTAAILFQFREVTLFGRPTRVAHYEQPLFAWR